MGHQWRSDRPLTLAEIKQYLERYPDRRLLNAYPRQSTNQRVSYESVIQDSMVHIYDKWTGEVYATFAIQDNILRNTYLADIAPGRTSRYRKLAADKLLADNLITHDAYLVNLSCKANNKN